jgi:crotonobetainyl-CoA:carnitine CoA-transferase CaiB-like acyl-CoA transferase
LLSVILDRGKRVLPAVGLDADGVVALLGRDASGAVPFDLVVADRVAGPGSPLAGLGNAAAYAAFVDRVNPGAWVTVSAFGLTGERRDDTATELTLAAAGGILATVRDPGTGRPLKLGGYQSLLNTGQATALAACHALDLARDGQPVHLDLSAAEATIAMGPTLEISTVLLNTAGPSGAKRYGAPASFYPCKDGMIRISAMEDHQWRGVVAAMGSPAWAERFATAEARVEDPDEIDRRIAEWSRDQAKVTAETLLQSHGVPATAMYSPAETLDSPQLRHRGSFEEVPLTPGDPAGPRARIVGSPCQTVSAGEGAGAGSGPAARRRSLRGLKVLEVSHVLAAPLAGALLGAMGADVSKLEDLRRIDMYRRRGPYIDGIAGGERSAYFALMNHSKRSVAFDVEAHPGRLDALLRDTDVVLENLGGKRAARLGVAAAEMVRQHRHALAVSSSGFGQDGPFAGYRVYAYNLQAACCLGYLTRNAAGESAEIDLPWADLISGFALATIVAAWAVGPRGNAGAGVDFAMADLIVAHFNEFVAAASLDPASDARVDRANEMSPYAPSGVYPAEDGWLAVSVAGDAQYARLAEVLGDEALTGAGFGAAAVRFARRAELDELLTQATGTWKAAELARDLRAAGVIAEEVIAPRDLPTVPQFVARDFFTEVEHREWGRRRLIGLPWRPFGRPPITLSPAPPLEPLDDPVSPI